jgi:hypothetical protein
VSDELSLAEPRLRRLAEELHEAGFEADGDDTWFLLVLTELDYALRPPIHERRVPTFGAIVEPSEDPELWSERAELPITRRSSKGYPAAGARRFADGMSSWFVRRRTGDNELLVFERPAGSERDLVVLAEATGGTMVQRHPRGTIRLVGQALGVMRWDGIAWHHEPPVARWIDSVADFCLEGDRSVFIELLEFAVHDLGSRGIGAILIYHPGDDDQSNIELRLPTPPPLDIGRAADLAPLVHVLGQVDGAAVFDERGTLRQLGVRLVPSVEAESDVEGYGGMRHTAARRYSYDAPRSTIVVVSEDGPVTVLRNGEVVGSSTVG